jgi:hypothetical protein
MAKISPSLSSKVLLSPTGESFNTAQPQVWSTGSPVAPELGANAAFQPAFRVNLGQSQDEFIKGKIQKILDRQKTEMRLIHDSLNQSYISTIEDLKIIHDIEKLSHLSADLDDVPLTFIYPDYLPNYLECRKMLAELNHIKFQIDNKKKTLEEVLEVTSINKDNFDNALSALKTSILSGIRTLKAYQTLSDNQVKLNKSQKELGDLIKLSKDKKESTELGSLGKSPAFTNLLDPDNVDQNAAQKKSKQYQELVASIAHYKQQISSLEIKTRLDNDFDLSFKSIHMFAKAKTRIQDEAKGCCTII